jgi:thymidylate synthase ThyX
MPQQPRRRVVSVGPLPPEKCAYALARYSRSADSIRQSLEWVRRHDSQRFLEHYYFQYGHASIADLGHLVLCFEGISELAAIEVEDEPLWDGQAKSSRYQDFSQTGFITPAEFTEEQAARYGAAAERLLAAYTELHARALAHLREQLPRPAEMKPEAYERNLAARAFDVARYLLFLGVPTNVGQITSIRTLEKQIRRLKASEYAEVRQVGEEMTQACAEPPDCVWDGGPAQEPLAPTLARHVEADCYLSATRSELRVWAEQNLPPPAGLSVEDVDLVRPRDTPADIVATLLYPVTDRPFRELYEIACSWSAARRAEVIDLAVRSRGRRDELLRSFRGNLYAFDIVTDIGAYRDLHRHRRCHQFRQGFSVHLGFEIPPLVREAGWEGWYEAVMREACETAEALPAPGSHYLAPFGARMRFLMKMDFAEAEYIARLRSGVKGHFSYRQIAWRMKQKMEEAEPELGRLIEATPPWVEDPLKR